MSLKTFDKYNEHKYYDEWEIPDYSEKDKEEEVEKDEKELDNKFDLKKSKVTLRYTTRLKKLIKKLIDLDKKNNVKKSISKKFLDDFKNLETNISFLDYLDDDNGKLSYLPKNRILRLNRTRDEKKGKVKLLDNKGLTAYKSAQRQSMRLGRIINNLWPGEFSEKDIELFVNNYKSEHDMMTGNINIQLVEGDDIAYWYDYHKYAPGGTLGNSCMRAVGPKRLAVYTENPDNVKLAIFTKHNKLEARALVWYTDRGVYMDRIYYTEDHLSNAYVAYADRNGWMCHSKRNNVNGRLRVKLKRGKRDYIRTHPYFDSFHFVDDGVTLTCC